MRIANIISYQRLDSFKNCCTTPCYFLFWLVLFYQWSQSFFLAIGEEWVACTGESVKFSWVHCHSCFAFYIIMYTTNLACGILIPSDWANTFRCWCHDVHGFFFIGRTQSSLASITAFFFMFFLLIQFCTTKISTLNGRASLGSASAYGTKESLYCCCHALWCTHPMILINAHTRGNRGVHDTWKLCTFPAKYWVQAYSLVCAIPPLQAKGGLVTLAYRDHSMWYVVCPSLQSILNRNSRRGTCQQTPFHLQRRGHTSLASPTLSFLWLMGGGKKRVCNHGCGANQIAA